LDVVAAADAEAFFFDAPGEEDVFAGPRFVISPGSWHTVGTTSEAITREMGNGVYAGTYVLFLWGELRYFDVFGRKQRHTRFRLRLKPDLGLPGAMGIWTYCDEGNEAD
jgi:hypothetical protein